MDQTEPIGAAMISGFMALGEHYNNGWLTG